MMAFSSGFGPEQIAHRSEILAKIEAPGLRRSLFSLEKRKGSKAVKMQTLNVAHSELLVTLRNRSVAAQAGGLGDPVFRDGFDVLCLCQLLGRMDLDVIALVRDDPCDCVGAARRWGAQGPQTPFHGLAPIGCLNSFLFWVKHPQMSEFAAQLHDLYHSGAAYGHSGYSLAWAVETAWALVTHASSAEA